MEFGTNKTPIDVTKKGSFGGTYCIEVHFGVNGIEILGKNLDI